MSEVRLREFKDKVSSYLDRVAAGEVVTVTKRGRPVATVIPADISPRMASSWPEAMSAGAGAVPRSRSL